MPYSYAVTEATNGQDTVAVPFPYLAKIDVHLFVNQVEVDQTTLTWANDNLIEVPTPFSGGETVRIERVTPSQDPLTTFVPGPIASADLNKLTTQMLYVAQEATDAAIEAGELSDVVEANLAAIEAIYADIQSIQTNTQSLHDDAVAAKDDAETAATASAGSAATASAAAADAELAAVMYEAFESRAQIAAWSPPAVPNYIRTAGYAAAGDGGAALYKLVGSEPSHAGKVSVTLADAVTVKWFELVSSPLNPRMFGAKGDGSTDDGSSFVNAMTRAVAANLSLYVSEGTYNLASITTPTLTGNLRVVGAGRFAAVLKGGIAKRLVDIGGGSSVSLVDLGFDTWESVVKLNDNTGGDAFGTLEIEHCHFTNINVAPMHDPVPADGGINVVRFVGNNVWDSGKSDLNAAGFRLDSNAISSAFIHDNDIRRIGGAAYIKEKCGICLPGLTTLATASFIVTNNRILDVQSAATLTGQRHLSGITIAGRSVVIEGNTINTVKSAVVGGVDQYGIYTKSSYSSIRGNSLINAGCDAAAIMSKGYPNDNGPGQLSAENHDSVIADNVILWDTRWNGAKYTGIAVFNSGMNIHDNLIIGGSHGIAVSDSNNAPVKRISIHHNKMVGMFGVAAQAIYAISLDNTTSVIIEGNEIDGHGSGIEGTVYAIRVNFNRAEEFREVRIMGNTIRDVLASTTNLSRGIVVLCFAGMTLEGIVIANNTIENSPRGIVPAFAGTISDVRIEGNSVRDASVDSIAWSGTPPTIGRMAGNTFDGLEYRTATSADTTPTVQGLNHLKVNNAGATTITQFDDGFADQRLLVEVLDVNTTIQHNANIKLAGGVNWVPANGGMLTLVRSSGVWKEAGRITY